MNLALNNKIVLITGGTGGIGSQIIQDFLVEEAIVICLGRNEAKMQELSLSFNENKLKTENLYFFACDLFDYDDMKNTIQQINQKFSRIDILVNCAGFADEIPFALLNRSQIDKMIDLNFKSPIYLTQLVLKTMFKQKEGNIVNVSSASAIKKGRGIVVYAAAKGGIETFTRTLAAEVGRKNIRVNCIRPGIIKSQMSEPVIERIGSSIKTMTNLERVGNASEISKMVLIISSNEISSYITGECITIDGGIY
ncbi:MAG: SDR family NAD(P)-dependent oxidoreductase [Flavobacteriia bacterium]|jgi:NAD(P)-dependent dehydrogenase (short-subunit alcohol dehydrogenase family)